MAGPAYVVVDPITHRTDYIQKLAEWLTWLLSSNPDENNNGSTVFFRGIDREDDGKYDESMIGDLNISVDQSVFGPVIMAFVENQDHADLGGTSDLVMNLYLDRLISNGSNPPNKEQLTIDSAPPIADFKPYLFTTDFVDIDVPSDSRLNGALEWRLSEGSHRFKIKGYFVWLKFNTPNTYVLQSLGRGAPRPDGNIYLTTSLYHIKVSSTSVESGVDSLIESLKDKIRKQFSQKVNTPVPGLLKATHVKRSNDLIKFADNLKKIKVS